ncbi:non-ribosomal peptide synthase/polyketide synthase [Pseudomonas sp. P9_35]|uniref:non-ribosomal peptide synthase/polyketide synthase n=1 Tax=unclassified Pseudomonas TaxID=196821 RepID=UPI002A363C5A|nr:MULTISPECIES: non-ribosomal peptide synthase/polyketide synthase [unclassified Pseudomonas]WPN61791.1 non-ribosomal peptide synthase/polyketide synthase [Pseudomonas sp. P9_32]WPN67546.1 non-ribosomal peptide synthase/polyketide synthase [Pseudomonas sp. P9_35]
MDKSVALRIAKRFITLPLDKRKLYLEKMLEEGVSPANLPIPEVRCGFENIALSYAQERQWFLWQMDPHSSAYHIPSALRLKGPLDVPALERSFNALVERHESLRTTFIERGEQAVQVIHPQMPLCVAVQALPAGSPASQDDSIKAFVEREIARPFDLRQGPLLRVSLLKIAEGDHVLVLIQHHIVADGWSMQVLVDELVRHYAADTAGESLVLPELTVQYADYAIWQRHWLEAGERERQLAYWVKTLGGEQPVLELPFDHSRPPVQSFRGARLDLNLPPQLGAALKQLAQRQGASLFMVLLASFQALLHRYSGQPQIRVGVPVANRNRVETEGLIGFFVNTQVLNAHVDGQLPFERLLDQVKQSAMAAQAHQDLPFEQLIQALQPERSLSHSPIFQVMFNHQTSGDAQARQMHLPQLRIEDLVWEGRTAQFDLTLGTYETEQGVAAELTYATDLFEAQTIERLARHWQNLLQGIVDAPQQRIGELPLLDTDQQRLTQHDWRRMVEHGPAACVHQRIAEQARMTPDALALTIDGQALTYGQLDARANQLAHRLLALGVMSDQRVGIAVERSVEMIVGLLAILKAGGAYVPLDPAYPEDRLAYMIQDSGIELLLTQARLQARLPIPATLRTLLLDRPDAALQAAPRTCPAVSLTGEHLAYVIYTSGSTGRPKGVMVRHGALSNFITSMIAQPGLTASDRMLSLTTFSFDIFGLEIYGPLSAGASIVLTGQNVHQDPQAVLALIERYDVTVLQATPSSWRMLLDHEQSALLAGRTFLCGGEALPQELAQRLLALSPKVWNLYGPTETTIWSALHPLSPENSRPFLGKPLDNTALYVVGSDLTLNPPGAPGELLIGGDGLARGYFQRPALTAERFVPDPFSATGERLYRTGDLTRYRAEGVVEYIGRIDHQVKIRGLRIELGEIEAALLAQESVRETVVVAHEGPTGAQLVGYVVPANGEVADESSLRASLKAALKAQLPEYMVPAHLVFLAQLPLTPNGKVDRKALPAPDATDLQQAYVAPRSQPEQQVAAIWQEVLKLERVGLEDNFFELGGHSLLVTQVVSRVRRTLGIEVPLRSLFEHSTLRDFVSAFEQGHGEQALAMVPVPRDKPLPLSFAQERQWFLWKMDPDSAAYNIPTALRLRGVLDKMALRRSFEALVARHESLRTLFVEDDGVTCQVIRAQGQVDFVEQRLAGDDETSIQAFIEQQTQAPFDLLNDALLRVALLALGEQEHILVLTLHHIVSDGWSLQVMVDDLMSLYSAFAQGQPAQLPALAVQYADYAVWQRQWMAAGERDRQLGYWTEQLGGEQPLLELPTDHPRPAQQSMRGARLPIVLDRALSDALKALARRENVTLFVLLLGSFQALLHRYSGQADIRVGVPIANRQRLETERLIGFFVNTQVLRTEFHSDLTGAGLLQQLKQTAMAAQMHQDLPFEQLVDALQPQRNLSHSPLFQAMFNHRNETASAFEDALPGLAVEPLGWEQRTAQFDLSLETTDSPQGLHAALIYATDLFEPATLERMGQHWLNLLQGMVQDLHRPIAQWTLLDDDERRQMLVDWNATAVLYPLERSVQGLIEEQVRRTPDAAALVFGEQRLSYGELNARANRLAHTLIEHGVGPDVLVGIAVERSMEMVLGLLAILKAGGAYVPLDPEYPRDRLAYMFEDSGIGLLLTQQHLLEQLPIPDGLRSLVLDLPGDGVYAARETNPDVEVHAENLAYVIYTSGSTGKPKGAGNRHSALVNRLCWMQQAYGLDATDSVLQKTPFSFDVSVWEFFWPLLTGATLVVAAPGAHRDPTQLIELITAQRITTLHFVPSMLQAFVQDPHVVQCSSLKRIVCSGEALPVDAQQQVFAKLPSAGLYNLYGPTEAAIDVTHWTCVEEGRDSVPIGQPIANLGTYILDDELAPVPMGVIGELYLAGEGLARGYHRRAALTAERFVTGPFGHGQRLYRTGDLARYRTDGVIEYAGRMDHQVKIRGLRIELGEIEARLAEHAEVRETVVIAQDGTLLVAYLVPARAELLSAEDTVRQALQGRLKDHLSQSLPGYMVPQHWVWLEKMPVSPNGKLERKALPKADISASPKAYIAPITALEQTLAAIWQSVLGREQVGVGDNFFELGGDSIISIQMVSRARQAGIHFSPKELFVHQTIQGLASVATQGDSGPGIDQGPVMGDAVLLPFQQLFFEQDMAEPHHWNQSVLLKGLRPVDAAHLEQALQALVAHHDALRLAFTRENDAWTARHQSLAEQQALWQRSPLLWTAEVADAAALERLAEQAQRSLELQSGALLRGVLASLADGSQRLLLVIHHLVVDGVSWRILLEDLQQAYQQLQAGQALKLPAKTSATQAWAQRLQGHAGSAALQAQMAYWQGQLQGARADLPCDRPEGELRRCHGAQVQTRLDKNQTRQLLQQAPAAYRTQVNDLLLTALARVIGRWTGDASTLIQLEGHGREALFDDLDLSRSVGWFTSLFPVRLTPAATAGDSLKTIKEQLRAIPDKGLGFGVLRYLGDEPTRRTLQALPLPRITFNYLGQFDSGFADDADGLFIPAIESAGAPQSPLAPLDNWLTLNGSVYAGELSIDWTFSTQMFNESTIQALALDYGRELQALIEHCCQAPHQGFTPSDFPLAGLTQAELDALPLAPRQVEDIYPLSPMQQGMLFHTLYEQQAGNYINQLRVDVEGLDVERFRQAWQAALDAHEVLRSSFVWEGEFKRALQVVHKQLDVAFLFHDWRASAQLSQDLDTLALAQRQQGFELEAAPLLRLVVTRVAEDRYHLIYTCHHILMDGWSNSQLLGEVLQRYSGQPVAASGSRYRDYIAWLQRQDAAASEAFWTPALQRLEAPTRLADAVASPAQASAGYGDHVQVLDEALTRRLEAFARTSKVTVNTLVQAAWLLLLQRYTGKDTVAFGATVAGRPTDLPGIEQQIGLFINTLPVIASPRAEQSLDSWLQTVQAQNLALREFEHTALLDIQRWAGQGGEALFDSLLVFENYPIAQALEQGAPDGLRFGPPLTQEQTSYPLTLLVGLDRQLSVHMSYQRASFAPATVARLAAHLTQLLGQMAAHGEGCLGELSMLEFDEHQRLTHDWNPVDAPFEQALCIHQMIARQVETTPDALAVTFANTRLSYSELDGRANRLAHKLIELGVGPEVRVGVAMPRSEHLLIALLAVLKAGGAYVPLDPDYPAERVAYMLDDSRARVLLTEQAVAATLSVPAETAVLMLDQLDLSRYPLSAPHSSVTPDNLAYVIYTSGSTGKPKGVAIAHRNVLALIDWSKSVYSRDDIQGVLASTSVCFDLSVWELFVTLANGGSLIIARNALELPQLPARDQVRLINTVPSAIAALQRSDEIPASVRIINLAGEPLKQSLVDSLYADANCGSELARDSGGSDAHGPTDRTPSRASSLPQGIAHVYDLYGPSEDTTYSTWTRRTPGGTANIGRPLKHTASYLLDADLQPVPQGVSAELYLSGAGITRGYLGRAAMTAEKYVPNPFSTAGERLYRTGDLSRYRVDGVLEYQGRIDHQVKIRGFRIELGEIEARLLQQPEVRDVAVLAQDAPGGQQLVAYVVAAALQQDESKLRAQLKAGLKEHLPDYMIPAHLLFLEQLPLTPNGKLDRKALPAVETGLSQSGYEAPVSELEQQIAGIWQEVLEVEQVGRNDHFFERGGHSLLATQAVSRLRKLTGYPLSLRDLFNHPQLKALAVLMAGTADGPVRAGDSHEVRLKAHGPRRSAPLSLVQRRLWIAEQLSGGTSAYGMPMALRLCGELSLAHLMSSFADVARRHDVLRTAYVQDEEGDPLALIADEVQLDFPVIDLSGLSPSAQQEQVARATLENARIPIDLEQAPLLRGRILRLGPTEHVLLYAMHHIISDGWSMGLLINELVQVYEASLKGEPMPLPPLEVQYHDFALWQQALEEQGVLARQAEYWKHRLGGYEGRLDLPLSSPRGQTASYDGDALQFQLSTALSGALRRLASEAGVTLYSTLLASFQVLLHRLCDAQDLVVGADVAGREQPELERLIGFFVNVLPLRSRFDAGATFSRFLGQTQDNLLGALEHQDLPFDQIVEASGVPRHKGMNPLLQVLFVMNNVPVRTRSMTGLSVELLPALETHSKFDMALFVDEEEGQLRGNWQFATTLFGHERIQHLIQAWTALLEQIVADQDIQLGAISMPVDNMAAAVTPATVPGPKADKLGKFLKRSVTPLAKPRAARVRESLVAAPQRFPLMLEPGEPHLDVIEWIHQNRPLLEQKLAEHAGILFRGFALDGIQGFEAFAEAVQPGLYGQYGDLPKKEGGKNTYRSTPYPERKMILFHNESSHQDRWPRKQMFYCEQAAPVGGATPVVDCRLMYERLPADLREKFEDKGLLYVRTFTDKLDVSWQHFFKTEDRLEVEARCRAGGIQWRWLDNDELQTRTPGPAIITHPITGEKSFFNQVQLHHIYWLDPDVREDLLSMFGLERMPRHVYYGDGTPIEDEVMARIGELYEACAVRFDWQKGDVILLDNMLVAHARDPFEGPRKIVVAMGDMYDRSALDNPASAGHAIQGRRNLEETGA